MSDYEEWELLPDDNYDGALEMSRRGRIMYLNRIFDQSTYEESEFPFN